jgi:hypothetical protein
MIYAPRFRVRLELCETGGSVVTDDDRKYVRFSSIPMDSVNKNGKYLGALSLSHASESPSFARHPRCPR